MKVAVYLAEYCSNWHVQTCVTTPIKCDGVKSKATAIKKDYGTTDAHAMSLSATKAKAEKAKDDDVFQQQWDVLFGNTVSSFRKRLTGKQCDPTSVNWNICHLGCLTVLGKLRCYT